MPGLSPNILALLPEYILVLTGIFIMLAEPCLKPASSRKPLGWIAIAGTAAAGLASYYQLQLGTLHAFSNTIQSDAFSAFFHTLIAAVVFATLLGSLDYFEGTATHSGEYSASGNRIDRTGRSLVNASSATPSSSINWSLRAFSACGRFRRISVTAP